MLRAGTAPTPSFTLSIAGQSLALEVDSYPSWSGIWTVLRTAGAGYEWPAKLVSATGGSSILKKFARTDIPNLYWYDEDTDSDGPLLSGSTSDLADEISFFGADALVWIQGEQDADQMTAEADKLLYKAGLTHIIDVARTAAGSTIPVIIGILGRRVGPQNYAGWQFVREAHIELASELTNVTTFERYHVELRDSVHPTNDGHREMGYGIAIATLVAEGLSGTFQGPKIGTMSKAGKTLRIPIVVESGATLEKPLEPTGFRFSSGFGTLEPVSWAWEDSTAVATFAETLSSILVYYPYRQGEGIDIDSVIRYSEMPEVSGALGLPLKSITLQTVT